MSRRLRAAQLIDLVLDDGTFTSWDTPVDLAGHDAEYLAELEAARARSGADEAVLTGAGRSRATTSPSIVGEFGFLGGSIGRATARRIVTAVTRATRERLPLLVATSSGGTRMQEGTPAFVEMVAISRAVVAHKAAGLPYLVYLRHPTTGGVFASWGSLGHVTVAEPGALVGFLGPRVFEALNGTAVPRRRPGRGEPRRQGHHRRRRGRRRTWPRSPAGCCDLLRPRPTGGRRVPARRRSLRAAGAGRHDLGVGAADPPRGPAGGPRAARPRRRRRHPAQRHRRRRARRAG